MKTPRTIKKSDSCNGPGRSLESTNYLRLIRPRKERKPMRYIKYYLTLSSLILFGSLASSASAASFQTNKTTAPSPNSVVILDTTVSGGTSSVEAAQAFALGFDVVLNDAATWGSMT